MSAVPAAEPDAALVLAKAVMNAAQALGISRSELGAIVGRDRTSIARGVDPASKAGELALLLVRCYRALYVLAGGEEATMKHWFAVANRHLGGVPRELVKDVQGLCRVVEYLDGMRGKL